MGLEKILDMISILLNLLRLKGEINEIYGITCENDKLVKLKPYHFIKIMKTFKIWIILQVVRGNGILYCSSIHV